MKKLLALLLVLMAMLTTCSAALAADPVGTEFHDGLVWYLDRTSGLYGYLDTKGNVVIKPQFSNPYDFQDGLRPFEDKKTGRFGYVDTTGKVVVKAQYKQAFPFKNGAGLVMDTNDNFAHYFLISPTGNTLVRRLDGNNRFYADHTWYGDYCIAEARTLNKNRLYYTGFVFITADGTIIGRDKPFVYITPFTDDGIAIVGTANVGKTTKYHTMTDSSNGARKLFESYSNYAPIANSYYYIDKNGNKIGGLSFTEMPQPFSEGYAAIQTYSVKGTPTWSYINTRGETVITGNFSEAYSFSDGMARVCIDGKYGYIDATGTLVIPAVYTKGGNFRNGLAAIHDGTHWGVINKAGEIVLPCEFNSIAITGNLILANHSSTSFYSIYSATGELLHENMSSSFYSETSIGTIYLIIQNGLYGYMTEDGKMIFEPQFDKGGVFSSDAAIVWKNGEWFIIDCYGNIVY